jgi:phosphoribosylformimino-5-aminoimidazole carboxamide ribonucleotide (ProFAR) isomerase
MLARTAPDRLAALARSAATLNVPVTYDAAIENPDLIDVVASLPFTRVVIGQLALFDGMLGRWAIDVLGDRTCIELALDGDYLFDPPPGAFGLSANEAAERMLTLGAPSLVIRDVTGTELPLRMLRHTSDELGIQTLFSGRVRTLADIRELTVVSSGNLSEIVVGDPLFDGSMRINEAIAAALGNG